jgi:uncharacterized protein
MTRKPHPAPTLRTRLRRVPTSAAYDRATIDAILDAQPVAHVGYVLDGAPLVTPTLQWRVGTEVYWHGSAASRMLRTAGGAQVCLTVTLTDGLRLARSAFEHSINYRSVMLFGAARLVPPDEATGALEIMMDQMFPARWPQLRPMTAQELKATTVLALTIDEASAKVSTGMPDDEADKAWPVWAGVVPILQTVGQPESDGPPLGPVPKVKRF